MGRSGQPPPPGLAGEFHAVRHGIDECRFLCLHQPYRLSNEPDGPGARRVYVRRFCASRGAAHALSRRSGAAVGTVGVWLLVKIWLLRLAREQNGANEKRKR